MSATSMIGNVVTRAGRRGRWAAVAVCLVAALAPAGARAAVEPAPGGPILVVTSGGDPFTSYYTEILRAEGLNEFSTVDVSSLSAQALSGASVVVLAARGLSGAQASLVSNWVQSGGKLIAMRPDASLAPLLGITATGAPGLSNAYLKVDTSQPPGAGITANLMQFHDTADRYALGGARAVASLYNDPGTPTANPAVTMRDVGSSGGQAAAFTYDLARSIVYTRQGNPAWAGQERDGLSDPNAVPIRSDDLFFGAKVGDVQPDWVDLNRVATPSADEQQRLLANLLTQMSADRTPLPRFWYLPRGLKAAVVLTGDDHASGTEPGTQNGTQGQFDRYKALGPAGCSVALWQCIRSTSYIFPGTPLSDAQVAAYEADGFEIALHLWVSGTPDGSANPGDKNCFNFPSAAGLNGDFDAQLLQFKQFYPSAPAPGDEQDALRRVERLVDGGERRGGPRRTARHHLLLLAGKLDQRPAWLLHGLGLPHALRRLQRVAHRRLPGGDAAHRRIRADHRQRGARVARRRIGIAGLLRRLHREHAHRCHRQPGRRHPRSTPRGPATSP